MKSIKSQKNTKKQISKNIEADCILGYMIFKSEIY